MKQRICALSLAFLLLVAVAGCKKLSAARESKDTPRVTLILGRSTASVGDTISVSFGQALTPPAGQQYWITLASTASPDSDWGDWHYVAKNASSDTLTAKTSGAFEVRLHDTYPAHPHAVIGRSPIIVGSSVAATTTKPFDFTLARTEVKSGQPFELVFNQPLVAPAGQQFWTTLAPVGSPDSEWGTWHYVPASATIDRVATAKAGTFEVRLHDVYPRHPHGVLQRQTVTVR